MARAPPMDAITVEAVVDVLMVHPGYHTVVSTVRRILPDMDFDDVLLWFTTRRSGLNGQLFVRTRGDLKAIERRRRRINDLLSVATMYVEHQQGWTAERVHARHQQEITFFTRKNS